MTFYCHDSGYGLLISTRPRRKQWLGTVQICDQSTGQVAQVIQGPALSSPDEAVSTAEVLGRQ
ncbi:hypothetical protein SAMN05428989_1399 [Pseudoxanthomonas sp. GM95]|uniref:hypothetical protein n=1 Tax=Pseudoxanthomonas sp. GM95 TaxID=1881043 RepID=UPI0008B73577|nr:hypothetical protein [Pseudoxanthomonas sp. GM95]SEL08699.1 hypothetical protein SAMN05428989_1399 [Pseudoxanthomonas sp. GM95]